MREPYIPLFTSVVRSSLWSLSGDCIKVFLTLCAEADPEGFVSSSIDGIRRLADLPRADVEQHLASLEGPDPDSKDRTRNDLADGARIVRVENGWRIVNLGWYRELARKEAEKARKRKWWNQKGSAARRAARPTQTETETDHDSDRDHSAARVRSQKPKMNPLTEEDIAGLLIDLQSASRAFVDLVIRDWLAEPGDPTDERFPEKWRVHALKVVRGTWRDQRRRREIMAALGETADASESSIDRPYDPTEHGGS